MAQLSRPYQVVLILVAVLALAWFVVLRSHASTGGAGGSASSGGSSQSAPKIGSNEHNQATPTPVYHGSAPGLKGLSKDVRRAHEAVGASAAQARKLESATGSSSAAAGGKAASGNAAAAPHASHATRSLTGPHSRSSAASRRAAARSRHNGGAARPRSRSHAAASRAALVSGQLRQGRIVLLLFWKPSSFDDAAVHSQVQSVSRALKGKVAADYARPREVGAFGTVTRDVSVLQTPTLLVINRRGLVTTITGLTDAFAIEQAVREAGG